MFRISSDHDDICQNIYKSIFVVGFQISSDNNESYLYDDTCQKWLLDFFFYSR